MVKLLKSIVGIIFLDTSNFILYSNNNKRQSNNLFHFIQGKIQGHNLYICLEILCVHNIGYLEKLCLQNTYYCCTIVIGYLEW